VPVSPAPFTLGDLGPHLGVSLQVPWFDVTDRRFGAKGDGVTDDTAAIQAADALAREVGGITYLPARTFRANLSLRSGSRLVGAWGDLLNSARGTRIQAFNSGLDTIKVDQGAAVYQSQLSLEDLVVLGGVNGFATYQGLNYLTMKNVAISGATNAQFYMERWMEEVEFDMVRLAGGTYGFRSVYSGAVQSYIDKATFRQVYAAGASKNGWRVELTVADAVTWDECNITSNGEHGFYLDGGARGLTFNQCSTEGNGQSGKKNRTTLTGTVSSGATSATLASSTGWATGDGMCIKGAGAGGIDFYILSTAQGGPGVTVSGTTVSWAGGTGATVTNPAVTNAEFDDLYFANTHAPPADIAFVGGIFGGEGALGKVRYGVNLAGVSNSCAFDSAQLFDPNIPVYDPGRVAHVIGGEIVRRRASIGAATVLIPDDLAGKFLSGAGKTTVTDNDFASFGPPDNGTVVVHYDTTASKAYISVRANGVWKVMSGPI
jgi:hypothetical protein